MYDKLGQREGIAKLVDEFYRLMSTEASFARVYATHAGHDLKVSATKLKAFLAGWTGGPQDYLNTYGHPRLRMRHAPFAITPVEAQEWHDCMRRALKTTTMSSADQEELLAALRGVTEMLINRP